MTTEQLFHEINMVKWQKKFRIFIKHTSSSCVKNSKCNNNVKDDIAIYSHYYGECPLHANVQCIQYVEVRPVVATALSDPQPPNPAAPPAKMVHAAAIKTFWGAVASLPQLINAATIVLFVARWYFQHV